MTTKEASPSYLLVHTADGEDNTKNCLNPSASTDLLLITTQYDDEENHEDNNSKMQVNSGTENPR